VIFWGFLILIPYPMRSPEFSVLFFSRNSLHRLFRFLHPNTKDFWA
jgi:hypothetical protein